MSERHDVFGSEARRKSQAARDARELARPVWYVRGWLALRPIFDRMLRRSNEDHDRHAIAVGDNVCDCGLDGIELAARRARKKASRAARRQRRFHRPISARKAARAAA